MSRTIGASIALLTFLAIGCAGPVAPERAQQEWDQEKVTSLAQELVQVAGDLRDSVRRAPPASNEPIGMRRARHRALDDLRVAQGSVRSLARQLEGGASRQETYPTFRRIQVLRRDIARNAQRSFLREPTITKLEQARVVLEKLDPFYAAEAEAYEDEFAD